MLRQNNFYSMLKNIPQEIVRDILFTIFLLTRSNGKTSRWSKAIDILKYNLSNKLFKELIFSIIFF